MKKLAVLLLLGCATMDKAQPYGQWSYHEHKLLLTSASYNVLTAPGHLMAGHFTVGNVQYGEFKLLKVDQNTTPIFNEDYKVFADELCAPLPATVVVDGVSAIETSSTPEPYAVSGSVPNGCFFATFDAAGVVQTVKYFTFNNPGTGIRPSQTSLALLPGGAGYLITGSYMGFHNGSQMRLMFIIKLDAAGNLVQSASFNGGCFELIPSSIILSPYTPNLLAAPEIVVVGEAVSNNVACPGTGTHSEAFFMRVDLNTLAFIDNHNYRHLASLITERNDFKSVIPTSFGGQNYFLVGGYSETSSVANDRAMMTLVDPTGAVQSWSYIYNSSYSDTRACMQVVKRLSSTYGLTFYGGVISASAGMLGIKVRQNGVPFTSSTPIDDYNEFNYNSDRWGNQFVACFTNNMSVEPNSGSSEGIHVYGTAETASGLLDNWYIVKASFNGHSFGGSVCSTNSSIDDQLSTLPGPSLVYFHDVEHISGFISTCSNISITQAPFSTVHNTHCSGSYDALAHSNSRLTGISESYQDASLSVWPNPAQNEIRIEFPSEDVSPVLKITDLNGRLVGEAPLQALESNIARYNLEQLGVEDGVYLIEAQTGSGKCFAKLILQR
jgi:hypothetical protein